MQKCYFNQDHSLIRPKLLMHKSSADTLQHADSADKNPWQLIENYLNSPIELIDQKVVWNLLEQIQMLVNMTENRLGVKNTTSIASSVMDLDHGKKLFIALKARHEALGILEHNLISIGEIDSELHNQKTSRSPDQKTISTLRATREYFCRRIVELGFSKGLAVGAGKRVQTVAWRSDITNPASAQPGMPSTFAKATADELVV